MAHESLFFIVLTTGYIAVLLWRDRIERWDALRFGVIAYAVALGLIALATPARSVAADNGNLVQVEIWF